MYKHTQLITYLKLTIAMTGITVYYLFSIEINTMRGVLWGQQ